MDYADFDLAEAEAGDCAAVIHHLQTVSHGRLRRQAVVAVIEDGVRISQEFETICEFLDITVERVPGHADLDAILSHRTPMAVICEMDGGRQDGCHVMKTVAGHDRSLPIMLLTGDEPALVGAAEAVEELWRLSEVTKLRSLPSIAGLVDFLFSAGRKGKCMRPLTV
jgi:hypothetical protein